MSDVDQRTLLGQFIRAHRERARPDIDAGRRRTPGLRREELADRAGTSTTWITFIEQGRNVQASSHVLGRIAEALSLTSAERAYLFDLAGRRDPNLPATQALADTPTSLRHAVQSSKHPAYGLDPLWNACCWNRKAAALFTGWLDADHDRNLLRFVFLSRAARRLIPDWELRATRLLAEFRADYSRRLASPPVQALVADLRNTSSAFARAWSSQDVLEREGGLRRFVHSLQGKMLFEQHTFVPAERADFKLILLVPAKDVGQIQMPPPKR
jgi:transcriptional regulator with XRE-family HTH domain